MSSIIKTDCQRKTNGRAYAGSQQVSLAFTRSMQQGQGFRAKTMQCAGSSRHMPLRPKRCTDHVESGSNYAPTIRILLIPVMSLPLSWMRLRLELLFLLEWKNYALSKTPSQAYSRLYARRKK